MAGFEDFLKKFKEQQEDEQPPAVSPAPTEQSGGFDYFLQKSGQSASSVPAVEPFQLRMAKAGYEKAQQNPAAQTQPVTQEPFQLQMAKEAAERKKQQDAVYAALLPGYKPPEQTAGASAGSFSGRGGSFSGSAGKIDGGSQAYVNGEKVVKDTRSGFEKFLHRMVGYDPNKVTGEKTDVGKLIGGTILKGVNGFSRPFWHAADWVLGDIAQDVHDIASIGINSAIDTSNSLFGTNFKEIGPSDNFITRMRKDADANEQAFHRTFDRNANSSGAAQIVDKLGTSTVQAIPFLIETMLTAGLSVPGKSVEAATSAMNYASGLGQASTAEATGLMLKHGIDEAVRNPAFWTSYVQSAAPSYEAAKEEGVDDATAMLYGLTNGFFNALIEIGGGIQDLNSSWWRRALVEGKEEVFQGFVERGLKAPATNAPLVSLDPEDTKAVINPATAAEEAFGGTAVGGLLSGFGIGSRRGSTGVNAQQQTQTETQTTQPATEAAQEADEQAKTAVVPAEQTIGREHDADATIDYDDVDYDGDVAFVDRTGKAILWDEREQNHDQLIGESNWSDRYGLRQAIRDGYIRIKPGNGIELSAENGVLSAEQEEGLKKLINNFKGKTFYVDLDVDLEDGSLYPRYSTSFTGADIDFRTIANWIDKNIRDYERSVSEYEAKKTAETPAGTREASGDIPAAPTTETALTDETERLNETSENAEPSSAADTAVEDRIQELSQQIEELREQENNAQSEEEAYRFYKERTELEDELRELQSPELDRAAEESLNQGEFAPAVSDDSVLQARADFGYKLQFEGKRFSGDNGATLLDGSKNTASSEYESTVDEESPFPPRDQDRAHAEEQYREQRYADKHGFDNAKAYEKQKAEGQREAEYQAGVQERLKQPDVEAAQRELGKDVHAAVTEAAKALNDADLITDEHENSGNARFRNHADAVNKVRMALQGIADGTSSVQELAEAYEGLNGSKRGSKGQFSDSYFYDERVADALEEAADAAEATRVAPETVSDFDQYKAAWGARKQYASKVERAAKMLAANLQYKSDTLRRTQEFTNEIASSAPMEKSGRIGQFRKTVNSFVKKMTNPRVFFEMLGGFSKKSGKAAYELARQVDESTARKINTHAKHEFMFKDIVNQKGFGKFATGKTKGNVKIGDAGNVSMCTELGLLKALEDKKSFKHIVDNGMKLPNEADYFSGRNNNGSGSTASYTSSHDVKLTKSELYALRARLKADIMNDPVAKALYDKSKEVVKSIRKDVAEVYSRMYGVDFAGEMDTYWHMILDGNNAQTELDGKPRSLEESSFIQKRKGSAGALRIVPFTEAMSRYIDTASDFVGFAELSRDIKTMSTRFEADGAETLTGAVNRYYGKTYSDYLNMWARSLDGNSKQGNKFLAKLRSNIASNSLLINASVALKQTPSYWNAASTLDYDVLLKNRLGDLNFLRSAKSYENNEIVRRVDELTGFLKSRKLGESTVEQGEATNTGRSLGGKIVGKIFPKWMTNWIPKQDVRTVSNLAIACYDQVAKNHRGEPGFKIGSDAHFNEATQLFEKTVLDTQPIYEKNARAEYLRDEDEVVRNLAMFRTQQTQNFNNLIEAAGELHAAKKSGDAAEVKAASKKLTNVVAGQITSGLVFTALQFAAKALLRKDDDYKDEEGNFTFDSLFKRLGTDFLKTTAGLVWFGDEAAGWAIDLLSGGETNEFYDFSDGVLTTVGNFGKASVKFMGEVLNSEKEVSLKTIKDFATRSSALIGVPLGNAYNMANALAVTAMDISGNNPDNFKDILEYIDKQGRRRHSESADPVFEALADSGVSLSDAVRFYNEIDVDKDKNGKLNGQLSQNEIFNWYKNNDGMEDYAKLIWSARGFGKSWDDYKAEHELDGGKYIEVKDKLSEAMKEDSRNYEVLDELLKPGGEYESLSDEAKEKLGNTDHFKKLYALHNEGFDSEAAFEVIDSIDDLKPSGDHKSVTQADKVDWIASSDLTDKEKLSAIRVFTSDDFAEKTQAAYDAGVSLEKWSDVYSVYNSINGEDLGAQSKADRFSAYLLKDDSLSNKQRSVIREQLSYYTPTKADSERFDHLVASKVDPDTAVEIADAMRGASKDIDKLEVIANSKWSGKDQWAALKEYTSESFYNMAAEAYKHYIDLPDYVKSYRAADTNGKGGLTQEELYNFYKADPSNEAFVKIMWAASGFSKSWGYYKAKHGG